MTDEQLADLRRFVKPLEWECVDWSSGDGIEGENDCGWVADVAGWPRGVQYQIDWFGADDFRIEGPDWTQWTAASLEAAKAAAQADYADRILSAVPDLLDEVLRLREALNATADQALREEIPERSQAEFDEDEFNRGYDAAIRVARAALGGAHD